MMDAMAPGFDFADMLRLAGTLSQMCTAFIAVGIGVLSYRFTKRQNTMTLINHNNGMANAVNNAVLASAEARAVMARLQAPIVGSPDDAVLFLYLNYVHNTYRMRRARAVSRSVWQTTADACATMLLSLKREQVEQLLARGYEPRFGEAVLRRYDLAAAARSTTWSAPVVALRAAA